MNPRPPGHSEQRLAQALAQLEVVAGELGQTVADLVRHDPAKLRALVEHLEGSDGDEGLGRDTHGVRSWPAITEGLG